VHLVVGVPQPPPIVPLWENDPIDPGGVPSMGSIVPLSGSPTFHIVVQRSWIFVVLV
jgi:hypothetical protein